MRVLLLSHTRLVSGGERSLLRLLEHLPPDVDPVVAAPPGPLAEAVSALGVRHAEVAGTEGSLRLHPVHTPAAVRDLARAGVATRSLARRLRIDLVHANSIRAGMSAVLAARLGGPPAAVHLHDCLPPGRSSALALRLVGRGAAALLANSRYTEDCFLRRAPAPGLHEVVFNPVDLERFDPARIDPAAARHRLGLGADGPVLAVVAQLTPWKAQDDAVRMLALLRGRHPSARLLLVGEVKFASRSTRYDNPSFERRLRALIAAEGLERDVLMPGEREDVPEILRAADVVLVPSWEEPFGMIAAEALAMEVPVAATAVGGVREIVSDGRTGLLLPPRRPQLWAQALADLLDDAGRRREMGRAGRKDVAARFSGRAYADRVVGVYRAVLAGRGR